MARRLALVIASYKYDDPGLRQLTAPAHDAEAFAAVLEDERIAGFDVTTLVNAPNHRVGEAIGDFYRDRRRDDITLLYFTGHGLKDDEGRLYLAMANTRLDSLLFTGLSAEQLDRAMETCASRQKILILDCCYSGAFPSGQLPKGDPAVHSLERLGGRGRTVLTASDSFQYSFEGSQVRGQPTQSVFTRHLVQGLRDGSADLDGDGDITVDELYGYVHDRIVDESPRQRPKKQDDVEGRIVIARNTKWVLPVYLHNAIHSPIANDRLGALDGLVHLHRIGNDVVRSIVHRELERLAGDDSRLVSAAARERLQALDSRPPGLESPPQPENRNTAAEPSHPREGAQLIEPPQRRPGRSIQWNRWRGAWRSWHPGLTQVGGLAALASGLLMAVGTGLTYAAGLLGQLWGGPAWYIAGLITLAALGGVLSLTSKERLGRWAVVAAAAASVFGATYLVVRLRLDVPGPPDPYRLAAGGWLELAGLVALLPAGVLAIRSATRDRAARARFAARFPRLIGRRAVVIAATSAVVLVGALGGAGWMVASRQVPRPLDGIVGAMALSPDGGRLYSVTASAASGGLSGTDFEYLIAVTDIAKGSTDTSTPTRGVFDLELSPDGTLLFAAGDVGLITFDTETMDILGEPVPIGSGALHVALSSDGSRAYVTSRQDTGVAVVDTATGDSVGDPIDVGSEGGRIVTSPDRDEVYVLNERGLFVIDTTTGKVVGDPVAVEGGHGLAVSPDGDRVYVTGSEVVETPAEGEPPYAPYVAVIDPATARVVSQIPIDGVPSEIVASPTGRRVYVAAYFAGLMVVDPRAQAVVGDPLDISVSSLELNSDGSRLFIGLDENHINVFDTAKLEPVGEAIVLR